MTMLTFEWSELVTDEFLAELRALSGDDPAKPSQPLVDLLSTIFSRVGGLPALASEPSPSELSMLARRLLSDAIGHYLGAARRPETGWYLEDAEDPIFEQRIVGLGVVDVNRADRDLLEALPLIGRAKAAAVIRERTHGGYFESVEDLVRRVAGLGERAATVLARVTAFDTPVERLERHPARPETQFSAGVSDLLRSFEAVDPEQRLLYALDAVASVVSRTPHPATQEKRPRLLEAFDVKATVTSEHVGVLAGREYYRRLPSLIAEASSSVRVAMFHAALPSEDHPTRALLDALVASKDRGAEVRVVLDRDRETDPYMSLAINGAAKAYLEDRGVACRFDDESVLLHSKYLVLDDQVCVVGSHNWSAGSYFHYEDLSFVVHSRPLADRLSERFDRLWGASS